MSNEETDKPTGRGAGERADGRRLIDRLPVLVVDGAGAMARAAGALRGMGLGVALIERGAAREGPVETLVLAAARTHDAVLVDGLAGGGPAGAAPDGPGQLEAFACEYVRRQWRRTPVCGCVLIGGRSRRMGTPKHLLEAGGKTWLERTLDRMRAVVDTVVIAGGGDVPAGLADTPRLPDPPEVEGPMAGVLAAMRWAPWSSWLVAACDLPELSAEALEWLLAGRGPGVWATVPKAPGVPRLQTLLAHYDFRVRDVLEQAAADGDFRLSRVADHPATRVPLVPAELAGAWRNVNTPEDLSAGG